MVRTKEIFLALGLALASAAPMTAITIGNAQAATADDLDKDATQALQMLYRTNPVAQSVSKQAKAILVFPQIVKAGLDERKPLRDESGIGHGLVPPTWRGLR